MNPTNQPIVLVWRKLGFSTLRWVANERSQTHNGVTHSNGLAKDDNLWKTTSNQRLQKLFSNVWIPSPPCNNTPTQKMDGFNHCQNWRKLTKLKEETTSNY